MDIEHYLVQLMLHSVDTIVSDSEAGVRLQLLVVLWWGTVFCRVEVQ